LPRPKGHQARLAPVLAYIADHFADPLTLAELAMVAGVSPTHLCHLFSDTVSLSPLQYLQRFRVHEGDPQRRGTLRSQRRCGRRVAGPEPSEPERRALMKQILDLAADTSMPDSSIYPTPGPSNPEQYFIEAS
jgi:Bacterial regulatory helix-turn-helix proteins, AraC family